MKNLQKIIYIVAAILSFATLDRAKAQLIITEVDASGSATSTYGQDWYELTNYGSSAINITGWKMDDNSDSFSDAVSLTGVTSINAGQSVVFIETTGATASTVVSNFESAWFGSNVPAGFTIGTYSGSGVGLSQSTDEVNIFNSSGTEITGVEFNASTANVTFDNSVAKLSGTGANDPTISTLSQVGVNGAFKDAGGEIGSPGTVPNAAPEPSSYVLFVAGALALLGFQVRRRGNNARA